MGYRDSIDDFKSVDLRQMRRKGFLEGENNTFKERHLIIDSKNGWKEVTECPLCRNKDRETEFSKLGVNIYRCMGCSLRYAGKIPRDVRDVYDDISYSPHFLDVYMKNAEYRKRRFGKERVGLVKTFVKDKKPTRLLDVGCGSGWFLEAARENGFEIYGQDLSKELAERTNKKLNIRIWNKPINIVNTDVKFDAITMFDLIEHVEDPLVFLRDYKGVLAEDGIILIYTQNFDSLGINVMKEHSTLIAPSEHLIYFTEKSIRFLADKLDMKILYYRTCGIDMGDLKSYYEWLGKKDMAKACACLYDYIQPVVDASGSGNHLRFILAR